MSEQPTPTDWRRVEKALRARQRACPEDPEDVRVCVAAWFSDAERYEQLKNRLRSELALDELQA